MIELQSVSNNLAINANHIIEKQNDNLAFAWVNLSFIKKSIFSKHENVILHKINGQINFGELTALMGPSGAGKTTLLSCINGLNQSDISNDTMFYVNKTKPIRSCFIVQNHKEHLIMKLTVKESMMYSSLLKNHQIRGYKFNHQENIEKILNDLLLIDCQDNLVVNCSGGEQKRLSIGLELTSLVKPNLMCIDEPTSGLDSHACDEVFDYFYYN